MVPGALLPGDFILKYIFDEGICMFGTRTANSCYPGRLKWCGNVQVTPLTHLPLPVFHPVPLCLTPTQAYHIAKTEKNLFFLRLYEVICNMCGFWPFKTMSSTGSGSFLVTGNTITQCLSGGSLPVLPDGDLCTLSEL